MIANGLAMMYMTTIIILRTRSIIVVNNMEMMLPISGILQIRLGMDFFIIFHYLNA